MSVGKGRRCGGGSFCGRGMGVQVDLTYGLSILVRVLMTAPVDW